MARKLKNWLTTYGDYTSMIQESPSIFHIWVGISMIAGAIGRKVWIKHPPAELYPNMYVVLVSPPGKSRKGAAIGTGVRLLEKIHGINISAEELSRQALIRDMANAASTFMSNDILVTHSSLVAISKELSVFLGIKNLPLLATLCELYDSNEQFIYKTIHRKSDVIVRPWLFILGATTPDWLVSSLPMDAVGGGWTSRVIFVVSEDRGDPKPRGGKPPGAEQLEEDLLNDLAEISTYKGEFQWNDKAGKMFDDWYINHKHPTGVWWLDGYFERKPSHLVKLAMILALSESDNLVIEEKNLDDALKLLALTELEMPRTFRGMGRSDQSQDTFRILQIINKEGKIRESDILAENWQHFSKWELDKMIETLISAKKITRVIEEGSLWFKPVK